MTLKERILKDLRRWEAWIVELEGVDMSDAGHTVYMSDGLIADVEKSTIIEGTKNGR